MREKRRRKMLIIIIILALLLIITIIISQMIYMIRFNLIGDTMGVGRLSSGNVIDLEVYNEISHEISAN